MNGETRATRAAFWLSLGVAVLVTIAAVSVTKADEPTKPAAAKCACDDCQCAVENVPTVYSIFTKSIPMFEQPIVIDQDHHSIAIIDPAAKQPIWMAYTVRRRDFDTDTKLSRNFHTPDRLRWCCLEQSDYAKSGYDIGHGQALASVTATQDASEVNSLGRMFAQRPALNRGPWLHGPEEMVRLMAATGPVSVMCGQLFIHEMPPLANADEEHRVASHNWFYARSDADDIEIAWLFDQSGHPDSVPVTLKANPDDFVIEWSKLKPMISKRWWEHAEK